MPFVESLCALFLFWRQAEFGIIYSATFTRTRQLLVLLGVGFATNSGAIGRFIGATAASVMDPINLLVASILGGIVLRHWMLFGILVFFGTSLSVIISIKNAHLGSILDFELVSAKVAAALLIGYVVNFVRILARR